MPQMTLEQANRQALEFLRAGRLAEAESILRQVLGFSPDNAAALHSLALIAQRIGRHEEAADLIRRAIMVDPSAPEYHANLGLSLRSLGRQEEAAAAFREAIRLRPDLATAHMNLGVVLYDQKKLPDAAIEFREAIRLAPNEPWAYLNLAKTLRLQDRLDEAETACRQALAVAPNSAHAYNMLGSCLREAGRIREAVECFQKAVAFDPGLRIAHSNLCYALYFDPHATPGQILDEHLRWARRFADPLAPLARPPENDPDPDRRLRIGYLSANLRVHVVGLFMEPILEHHDRERFEIVCYNDAPGALDHLAMKFKSLSSRWHDTAMLEDRQLADLIRQDRIDILVDLNLHMKGDRLAVFGGRSAPVQITHLAYCGTSGLGTMDWCVTDPHMLLGGSEQYFTEKMLPLAASYWCYRPSPGAPEIGPLPASKNGFVTFGSLNTLAKVNDGVVELWAKLLEAAPNSKLAVHVPGGQSNPSILDRFARLGIPSGQLDPLPRRNRDDYLALYNRIDIALDPFPYCGGTTTFDALWMGVPLVTLAGQLPLARAGVSILTNLGMPELIAQSPEHYIRIAAEFAADKPRLAQIRSTLRSRLRESVLLDEPRYVRDLERAFRNAWQHWCRSERG